MTGSLSKPVASQPSSLLVRRSLDGRTALKTVDGKWVIMGPTKGLPHTCQVKSIKKAAHSLTIILDKLGDL